MKNKKVISVPSASTTHDGDESLNKKECEANFDAREWDAALMKWKEGSGPMPGAHPNPNHIWNTNQEYFLQLLENEEI